MHPIESMMTTAMEQIKQMVDVNTIIGDPVQTRQGNVILPISKVSFGFVAGGGEYGKGGSIRESNKDCLLYTSLWHCIMGQGVWHWVYAAWDAAGTWLWGLVFGLCDAGITKLSIFTKLCIFSHARWTESGL